MLLRPTDVRTLHPKDDALHSCIRVSQANLTPKKLPAENCGAEELNGGGLTGLGLKSGDVGVLSCDGRTCSLRFLLLLCISDCWR